MIDFTMLPRRLSMPDDGDAAAIPHKISNKTPLIDSVERYQDPSLLDSYCNYIEVKFHSHQPFGGIIDYLAMKNGGNPIKAGIISVHGNSFTKNYERVYQNIVDRSWSGYWCSSNEQNSYLCFDFLSHKVHLTHYTIKTYNGQRNWRHLKSWALEGSNDDDWKEIHRVKKSGLLNGPSKISTFPVKNAGSYKSIRIRITGHNYFGDNHLFLSGIEFFGQYY
ncbi:F5/8 type C domain containing protein [Tritrichomonas foetus]|uniref:F5/8 type C domain containing protein n=1 Tax=Tritrichomonas foetus TaxID=1144522 RepID=A0A1J4JUN6_9EUKA|nr:F5/8 type C domain containing protein [Tritrichomonas foetus]|eukprot:OHT00965.1 F5/8 type C domain containing protein [Tritrichomonas foetus]